jgi:hypothetical protein
VNAGGQPDDRRCAPRSCPGRDDAATQYLRSHSESALRERFTPIGRVGDARARACIAPTKSCDARNRALALLGDPTVELNRTSRTRRSTACSR